MLLLTPQSECHGGPPEGNLHGHVFGHTVRSHLVARFLGAQLESSFAFKFCCFFFSLSPWVVAVSLHFSSIFDPFWRPLGSILHHFGAFWRPLGVPGGGPGRRDVFSLIFEAKMVAKGSPRGSQNPFKMGSKFHCFFDSFLDTFWVPNRGPNRSLKRSKNIKKGIQI